MTNHDPVTEAIQMLGNRVEAARRNFDRTYQCKRTKWLSRMEAEMLADPELNALKGIFSDTQEAFTRLLINVFEPGTILQLAEYRVYGVVLGIVEPVGYSANPSVRIKQFTQEKATVRQVAIRAAVGIVQPHAIADPKLRKRVEAEVARLRLRMLEGESEAD